MDREVAREARDLLASARGWLEELHEEGIEALPPQDAPVETTTPPEPVASAEPPQQEPAPAAPKPASAPPPPPAVAATNPPRDPLGLISGGSPFGEHPTLDAVREALGECTRCRLHEGRSTLVFGDGNPNADLVFVGEGPGAEEDKRGLPFVGRAGELLTQMIEKGLGIPRSEVYICNIVKCRPPNNRTPMSDEVTTCSPYLDGQLAAIQPKVIVALGKPASSLLLGRDVAITRVRGQWHDYRGTPLMPTLHPAFVLRQYTPENRRAVWEDLKAALARARES